MGMAWDSLRGMTDPLGALKDFLMNWGLEAFCKRYYGAYESLVVDNKDPEGKCRVRAIVPALNMVTEEDVPDDFWIDPSLPGLGTEPESGEMTGMFWPPEKGAIVWVKFRFGDSRFPVYDGGCLTDATTSDTFESADAFKRGLRTRAGHFIKFDDDPDNLSVLISKGDGEGQPSGSFLSMDTNGSFQFSNEQGSQMFMDAENNETTVLNSDGSDVTSLLKLGDDEILMSTKSGGMFSIVGKEVSITGDNVVADCNKQFYANAGSVKIGANAMEPAVRGNKLMQWGLLHQHPTGAPFAPTMGSILPLVLMNELSEKVTIA